MNSTPNDIPIRWTTEQILGLAPDKYSLKTSRGFAIAERWLAVGRDPHSAWGEFPLKDKPPLQIKIDLAELAIACTCKSRKFPCYHGLGLLLLLVEQPHYFIPQSPPPWLSDWLAERTKSSRRKQQAASYQETFSPEIAPKKFKKRQALIVAGLQELDLWLQDMVRHGFASLPDKPKRYWFQMADRLVDAQAGEVASQLRQMATIPGSQPDWPERLLRKVGRLHLLIQGFQQFETLPPETQADLQTAVGWQLRLDGEQATTVIQDRWQVVGRHLTQGGKQKTQRTWLWGEHSNRAALLVNVSHGQQLVDTSLVVGTAVEAEVCFQPSATPLRAHLVRRSETALPQEPIQGYSSIQAAQQAFAHAIAHNPWVSHFPIFLSQITPVYIDDQWMIQDAVGNVLRLPPKFSHGWHLQALHCGGPFPIFGEWDGEHFQPLTVWRAGRLLELHILGGVK